ncbi:MAG: hypothetical protein M1815_004231 [Lichina confinis]|nr:MAG: hypothetical protein M1815_004231 [Lichina confinis]
MATASDGQEQTRKERRTIVLRRLATRMLDRVSEWVDHGTPRYRKMIPISIKVGRKGFSVWFSSDEPPLLGPVGGVPMGPGPTAAAGAGNAAVTQPTSPTSPVQTPVGSIGPSSTAVANEVIVPPQTPAGQGAANGVPHGPTTPFTPVTPVTPVTPPQASPPQTTRTTTPTVLGVVHLQHMWVADNESPGRGGGAVGGGRGRGRGTLWT